MTLTRSMIYMYLKLGLLATILFPAQLFWSQALWAQSNTAPTAVAGSDFSTPGNRDFQLDGSGSSDIEDGVDQLQYQWTLISGAIVSVISPFTAITMVDPLAAGSGGTVTLTFQLQVKDSGNLTATDEVNVTLTSTNLPADANAGLNQLVAEGSQVILDGSLSTDPENLPLLYNWSQLIGTPVTLSDVSAIMPSFTAPFTAPETLEFQLRIFDGFQVTSDTVSIAIQAQNGLPVADAGSAQTWPVSTLVTLDGSGSSDPDQDILSYTWTQRILGEEPQVVLDTTTDPIHPSFTGPDSAVTLTFDLVVNDGNAASPASTVTVTFLSRNSFPRCDRITAKKTLRGGPKSHDIKNIHIAGLGGKQNLLFIDAILQDEPTSGLSVGDSDQPDAIVTVTENQAGELIDRDVKVLLRNERDPSGDGRLYQVDFTILNQVSQQQCSGSIEVCAPRKKRKECVDSGLVYDSFN